MPQERRTIKRQAPQKKEEQIPVRKSQVSSATKKEIAFVISVFSAILLMLGIYTTSLSESDAASSVGSISGSSLIGHLGVIVKWLFTGLFGPVAYLLPILLVLAGIYIIKTRNCEKSKLFVYISGFVFVCCLSALFYIFGYAPDDLSFNFIDFWNFGCLNYGGGILGALLGYPLILLAKTTGAAIIIIAIMIIAFIAMTDFAVTKALASLVREAKRRGEKAADDELIPSEELPSHPVKEEKPVRRGRKFITAADDIVPKDEKNEEYVSLPHAVEELGHTGEAPIKIFNDPQKKQDTPISEKAETSAKDEIIVKPKRLEGEIPVEIDRENTAIPYVFPETELLTKVTSTDDSANPKALRELSVKLVETLKSFNIDVKVLEISKGPAITRFELQPTAGVRVSKITSLADDIALSLAATSVRIEAPIPGKAAIGIELPNSSVSMVSIRDVLESKEFRESKSYLSCALGRDIAGKCIVGDIAKMPHVLIAGATGSGKSVCINSLIASILYKSSPNDVKLIMIDPKVVELSVYNGIPHLLIPVVTDARKAAGSLNWAVQEMTTRYKFFADNGVRDLKGYNKLMEKEGMPKLPQIVIIIDELADLMMVAPKDVESYVCRLAQLARAAGMHLVIATQRPSVDVITGVIKANIPSRIAFAVSSYVDSRTILDAGGAEKLLGRGDMLFYPMGANKPTRIQGAFISDEEVEKLVDFVKKTSEAVYDENVLEQLERAGEAGDSSSEEDDPAGDADPLLPKAIEIVVNAGQASVSLVQRRLSVGYSRAGRLVDQMENRGIVGPHEGSKPRKVLVTKAEYLNMLENAGVNDASAPPRAEEYPAEDVYIEGSEPEDDEIIMPPSAN